MNKISQATGLTQSHYERSEATHFSTQGTASDGIAASAMPPYSDFAEDPTKTAKELHKRSSLVLNKLEHGSRLFESLKKVYPLDNLDRDEKTIEPMHFALWDAIDDKSPWGEAENKAANKFIKLFYEHMKEHPKEELPSRIKFLIEKTNIDAELKEMVQRDIEKQDGKNHIDKDDYYRLGSLQRDISSQKNLQEVIFDIDKEIREKPRRDISNNHREALETNLFIINEQHREATAKEKDSFVKIVKLIAENLAETEEISGRFPENKFRILSKLFKHLKGKDIDGETLSQLKKSANNFSDYKNNLVTNFKKSIQRIHKSPESKPRFVFEDDHNDKRRDLILFEMARIANRAGAIDGKTLLNLSGELINPDNQPIDDSLSGIYHANAIIQKATKVLQSNKIQADAEKSFLPGLIYNILSVIDGKEIYPETIDLIEKCNDPYFLGSTNFEKIKERVNDLKPQVVEL